MRREAASFEPLIHGRLLGSVGLGVARAEIRLISRWTRLYDVDVFRLVVEPGQIDLHHAPDPTRQIEIALMPCQTAR